MRSKVPATGTVRDLASEIRALVLDPTLDSIERLVELTRRPPTPNVRLLAIDGLRLKFAHGVVSRTPGSAAVILDAAIEMRFRRDLGLHERELVEVLLTDAVRAVTPIALA